jgi:hypothetical protein
MSSAPLRPATSAAAEAHSSGESILPSLRLALRSLESADASGDGDGWNRALTEVAHCYQAAGDPAQAEWHLRQGLRRARTLGQCETTLELLCEMASAALAVSIRHARLGESHLAHVARERVRDYSFEAIRLLAGIGSHTLQAAALLRLSDLLERCGDTDDAHALHTRALRLLQRESALPVCGATQATASRLDA